MLELGVKALFAYLLGSFMGALLVGRLRGVDIRGLGSGNAGGTNALRTQGPAFAAGTVVVDVGKAVLAVGLLPRLNLPVIGLDEAISRDWLAIACAAAVVAGHVWPLYHDFRGGKGAATLLGAFGVLAPVVLLPVLAVWFLVVVTWGYVGLATMAAAVALPIVVALLPVAPRAPLELLAVTMAVFVIYTHRANIERMRSGNENRVSRLWLFRPRDGRQ